MTAVLGICLTRLEPSLWTVARVPKKIRYLTPGYLSLVLATS